MSKDKAEEKAREIIERTFGDSTEYILERVSVEDFMSVIYNYNFEYNNSTENAQLRAALSLAIQSLTDISDPIEYLKRTIPKEGYRFDLSGAVEFANNGMSVSGMAKDALSKLAKAKQLLTDNTQEETFEQRLHKRRNTFPDKDSIHGCRFHVYDIDTNDYVGNLEYARNPLFSEEELEDELKKHFPNYNGKIRVAFEKF